MRMPPGGIVTVTRAMKDAVIARDGSFCLLALPGCLGEATTADHRANRGQGGSKKGVLDHPANLIAACTICNGEKENATGQLRLNLIQRGLRVEKAATNAQTLERVKQTPVEYLDGGLFLLVSERERVEVEWCDG